MLAVKKVLHDIYNLERRKHKEGLIEIYEECKGGIFRIEEYDKIEPEISYFKGDILLKKQIEDKYKELEEARVNEIEALRKQIDDTKELEFKFKELNDNLKKLKDISREKDKKIKELENKIKQAEQ